MPKSIEAQIPIEGEVWWFLESKEKTLRKIET